MRRTNSLFMDSFNKELNRALKSLYSLLSEYKISFVFIGGVARNQYAPSRITEDINILVNSYDLNKVKNLPIGYIRDLTGNGRSLKLHDPETYIDVIYTEDNTSGGIEYAQGFGQWINYIDDLPFLSLEMLVQYKLSSGIYGNRLKDFGDVQDLIAANRLDKEFAKDFRQDLKDKYYEIFNLVKKEIK